MISPFTSSLGVNEKLIVFTQSVLLVVTCRVPAVLISVCQRTLYINEVSFVNIRMFGHTGITSCRQRSKATFLFFSFFKSLKSLSFSLLYLLHIHLSVIFIYL